MALSPKLKMWVRRAPIFRLSWQSSSSTWDKVMLGLWMARALQPGSPPLPPPLLPRGAGHRRSRWLGIFRSRLSSRLAPFKHPVSYLWKRPRRWHCRFSSSLVSNVSAPASSLLLKVMNTSISCWHNREQHVPAAKPNFSLLRLVA